MSEDQSVTEIAALARAASKPHEIKLYDGRIFIASAGEVTLKEVSDAHGLSLTKPRYITQFVNLQDVGSLVGYVNDFKRPGTVIFADIKANRIDAMLDYHLPDQADHVRHRAHTQLQVSEEWKLWTGMHQKYLSQLDFARFLEENADDVIMPQAADLIDAIKDIYSTKNKSFTGSVKTSSDAENFSFESNTESKSKSGVDLPTKFTLSIPVYFGEGPVPIYAFLRSRAEEGKLYLALSLNRMEFVRQTEFKRIVSEIDGQTGVPCMFGTIG